MLKTIDLISKEKIIVIIRGLSEENVLKTTQAMYEGGIRLVEVTFNQSKPAEETAKIIEKLAKEFDGKVSIGAGTVVTEEQLIAAANAGAKYIISPNTDIGIIRKTKELGLVSLPGSLTPTEIVNAHNAGADFVKIFPVSSMSSDYIKNISAPLNHIKFLAVGGVDINNMESFFRQGACGIGIGGNIVNKKLIEAGEFDKITALAKEYTEKIKAIGGNK
ncbi:MAG: bifunctional 4-hydroxy-2-oxoglutarate aldolase/2-dehydro-3-deoxy-phosphogluconate aldolase [Clostridia bacterium]|nr:bifunctional 4-hydroxy-2-oxoglutarate aldolase/2-dehydro-3-deoxy-phosphogluconate aldolase [Clostridia bacterium]